MIWRLWIGMALLVAGTAQATDCGSAAQQERLRRTESLVLSRAPMEPVIGEFPTPQGTPACARLSFSIGSNGEPIDLVVTESSGDMAFALAAMRAVKKYRFRREFLAGIRSYTLVIKGVANQATPEYFRGVDRLRQHSDGANKGLSL